MTHRLGLVAVIALTGCAVAADDLPRDIPPAQQIELATEADRGAGASTGTARIYLLTPDVTGETRTLGAVARDVEESPLSLLTALFAGPNSRELSAQFRSAIPVDTALRSAALRAGTLVVDVSADLLEVSGDTLISAVAQIVFTASELSGVRAVKIVVDGADQQWPTGNGELQSSPLTVYDFPGRLASAQPDFPAIPSPPTP